MIATPSIITSVKDCKYLNIEDTTVTEELYGRVFFLIAEGSTIIRSNFDSIGGLTAQMELIKDGLHTAFMVVADIWKAGTYVSGSVVLSPAYNSEDPPIDGSVIALYRLWIANKETALTISDASPDWDLVAENETSFDILTEAPNVKVATQVENVDCKQFNSIRKACNVMQLSKSDATDYKLEIYSVKSYINGEILLELPGAWVENKMELDFGELLVNPTDIYVVDMINPLDESDHSLVVMYNLCMVHECMQHLIRNVICKECSSCTPSKEEQYRRYTLNRMLAIYVSLIMNIHYAEVIYLGESDLSDTRYEAIVDASNKLDNLLLLMDDCGECRDLFANCSSC